MSTASGRQWLIFNGEIYNFLEIREELCALGHVFRSCSDTEVLLAAWQEWGEDCLSRMNGMFAFILLDLDRRVLFAARDRFAVKPLYLWRSPDGRLAFASEIKAFAVLSGWKGRINPQGAYDFLNWGLTDHRTDTMFQGVTQLAGGEYILLGLDDALPPNLVPSRWYTATASRDVPHGFEEASEQFATLFRDAVRLRLRADVPVGTGLSGGLDSSSIVCTMADLLRNAGASPGNQHSFSACAEDSRFDERQHIDRVIAKTGIANHRCFPDLDKLLADLPALAWHQDEPFGSASIFAEWSVFGEVRDRSIKVTLDGHGADELLCGYSVYHGTYLAQLIRGGHLLAALAEGKAQRQQRGLGVSALLSQIADPLLPIWLRDRLRSMIGKTTLRPEWIARDLVGPDPQDPFVASGGRSSSVSGLSTSQLVTTSLPMQLHWCDRDSMAHGVESRAPFLDYRLVEFLLGCPDHFKIGGGWTKRILRRGMSETLPREIAARRDKMGFVTPESEWVCKQAPERFKKLVAEGIDLSQGALTSAAQNIADDVIDGKRPYSAIVWRITSFAAWVKAFNAVR